MREMLLIVPTSDPGGDKILSNLSELGVGEVDVVFPAAEGAAGINAAWLKNTAYRYVAVMADTVTPTHHQFDRDVIEALRDVETGVFTAGGFTAMTGDIPHVLGYLVPPNLTNLSKVREAWKAWGSLLGRLVEGRAADFEEPAPAENQNWSARIRAEYAANKEWTLYARDTLAADRDAILYMLREREEDKWS